MVEVYNFDKGALALAQERLGFPVDEIPANDLFLMFTDDGRLYDSRLRVGKIANTDGEGRTTTSYHVMWRDGNGHAQPEATRGKDRYIVDPLVVRAVGEKIGYDLIGAKPEDVFWLLLNDIEVQDPRIHVGVVKPTNGEGTAYSAVWVERRGCGAFYNRLRELVVSESNGYVDGQEIPFDRLDGDQLRWGGKGEDESCVTFARVGEIPGNDDAVRDADFVRANRFGSSSNTPEYRARARLSGAVFSEGDSSEMN